ncbi:U5 small nuclear ribonucleoprotein 40 kDa protein isoform X1 [Anopheles cruzii]|uniref:U5 small nuclear ribonucleoprotein 40 kDa protein isoform X1 n=1 Tax=Anopheles cruzii TaxID=68878 RepID=UPI0022EC63A7|nr:U5 small nuclear ribonucleoprotein 40 kDa protein isoform X1 [Anopheles cruzii]
MASLKRSSDALVPVASSKKSRTDLVSYTTKDKQLLEQQNVERTSGLLGPIMLLEGHGGEIFSTEFHPEGEHLLSTGFDRQIFLWKVYDECDNVGVLSGHSGAVMEAHFSPDGSNIYSCATDKVVGVWDVPTCTRIRKLKGHTSFINSCRGARRGPTLIVSGSDDSTIKIWDARKRNVVNTFDNGYQVTAVCFNDTAEQVVSGGIDNEVKVWDIRKKEILYRLRGHTDTITGLSLSPDGSYVLSNAMDNTLRIWDIRPYVPGERCVKVFTGHQHNFEKNLLRCGWSPDGLKISAGSADRYVYIWDTTSRRILYKLPGHNGSVNDVDFHPTEPIVVSGSSDKTLYLGEIEA